MGRFSVVVLVGLGIVLAGCKKDEEAQTIPVDATATAEVAADPAPTASAAPAGDEDGAPTPTPTPTPRVVATNAAPSGASIDACCSALSAVQKSGKGGVAKNRAAAAAQVCPGIAKLVKSGQTSRSAGLTQIRSALAGSPAPAECN